jgi:3-methylcrotonyl-CoA carboxylase alpha subunit
VREGDSITPYYDPMIAKLVCWGESREIALARDERALARVRSRRPGDEHRVSSASRAQPRIRVRRSRHGLIERERAALFPAKQRLSDEVVAPPQRAPSSSPKKTQRSRIAQARAIRTRRGTGSTAGG